jgi:hypothetical protein
MAKKMSKFRMRPVIDETSLALHFEVLDRESEEVLDTSPVFKYREVEHFDAKIKMHGLNTLLQQRTSQTDIEAGKLKEIGEYFELLKSGEWARERVGGPGVVSAEIEAIAKIKGVTIPQVQKALKAMDETTRAKVLANAKVVEMAKAIREEREETREVSLVDLA